MHELLTRSEWEDADEDHPAREQFETFEEYQRHVIATGALEAADVVRRYDSGLKAVGIAGVGILAYHGLDALLDPY
jgi:hypothetical protein